MTTRAIQVDFLLSGLKDPNTSSPLSGGTVTFYAAGTSNLKNVWTEVEKTNAFTTITLGSDGIKHIYADGIYKLIVKHSDGSTLYTWDNLVLQATTFTLVTKTNNYEVTPDVDWVLVDTSGGAITISMQTAADFNRSVTIKNIGSAGYAVTVDPYTTETIDGSLTATIEDGNAQTYATDNANWYAMATHASTHNTGGQDEVDGDKLDIDFTPTRYAPGTTPAEADSVDNLTAHLYGLDQAIIAAQDDKVTAKTGDDTLTAAGLRAGVIYTNTGAGAAVDLTLPAGADGMSAMFVVTVNEYFRCTADGTEKFRYLGGQSAAGGYIRTDVVGTVWKIVWIGSEWQIVRLDGELSVDE